MDIQDLSSSTAILHLRSEALSIEIQAFLFSFLSLAL
jgi:hypothetical protein